MKLNLVPKHVSKAGQSRGFMVLAIVIVVLTLAGSFLMFAQSNKRLNDAVAAAEQYQQTAADAVVTANDADRVIGQAAIFDRNLKLAQAMLDHNFAYTQLYDDVFAHIPSFFRLNSISATPNGAEGCTVTLTGFLDTFQQYADMNLALLRIPGAVNVARSGYVIDDKYVPNLTETDQNGAPIKPGEAPLPSDPWERWQELERRAAAAPQGFQNVNGFGTMGGDKGAMPGFSTVTFTVTIMGRDIQTPDPTATIMALPSTMPTNTTNNATNPGRTTPPLPGGGRDNN